MESPEATVFVHHGDGSAGTWTRAEKLPVDDLPWGFVGLKDTALLVHSQNVGNAAPFYSGSGPGTTVYRIAPDGTVAEAKLAIPQRFMAWSASADDGVLSMLGTTGSGVELVRVTPSATTMIRIQRELAPIGMGNYTSQVHERAGTTIVVPVDWPEDTAWKPSSTTPFVLQDDKPIARTTAGGEGCSVKDAMVVGDAIWSIRRCYGPAEMDALVRLGAEGKTERVAIPPLVKAGAGFRAATTKAEQAQGFACRPAEIFVRGKSDVWVSATCGDGALPAIYRLGRAQEPILLP